MNDIIRVAWFKADRMKKMMENSNVIRLPNFDGDKWETYVLQHVLHLVGDDLYGHILHLRTVLDVAECRIIVGVAGTRHDVIGRCL